MSAIPYPEDDPELEVVESVLNQVRGILGEHFDCGVVLLTKDTDGITSYHSTEFGNKFAIRGMVDGYVNGEFDKSETED
jgi:hypothetical protein